MDHKQVEELIDAHALGALDEPERSQVQAHLDQCGDCRVQFEEASRVAQQLALAVPVERAPEGLFHSTMADIHRDIAESQPRGDKVSWLGAWSRRIAPVSAAAASLIAVAALGFTLVLNERVDDDVDDDGDAAQQQQLVNLALAADDRQQASLGAEDVAVAPADERQVAALYVWSPKHAVGVLIVSGLVAGKGYMACYETAESGVRNGGELDAHDFGSAQTAFPIVKDDPLVAVGITSGDDCQRDEWLHHWEIDDPTSCLPVLLTSGSPV